MTRKKYLLAALSCIIFIIVLFSCSKKKTDVKENSFTKVDSLMEQYLALQDSMLYVWNVMVDNDNRKIIIMHRLLQELKASHNYDSEMLNSLEERLAQLEKIRYDQKTMINDEVVQDYDFMTNSLITELTTLAEPPPSSGSDTIQKLVDDMKSTDQLVSVYREEYDHVVDDYNRFIEMNKKYIKQIDQNISLEKKPLFQIVLDKHSQE